MGFFWTKYKMFELKNVWRSFIWWHWILMQHLKENFHLHCQKWLEEFSKFSPEHVRKSKNWDFDGILSSKVKSLWALNLQGSFVSRHWRMMQNLKRNRLASSKLTWGIWQSLTRALENPKNLHFNWLLLMRVYNAWGKKRIEELCLMALKLIEQFEGN